MVKKTKMLGYVFVICCIIINLVGCGKDSINEETASIPDNITDTRLLYEIGNKPQYPSPTKTYGESEIQDKVVKDILDKKDWKLDYELVGFLENKSYKLNHTVYKVSSDSGDYDVWLLCYLNYAYTNDRKDIVDCELFLYEANGKAEEFLDFITVSDTDTVSEEINNVRESAEITKNEEVLQTEYYSIVIPADWNGKYSYQIIPSDTLDGAYNVDVYMNSKNEVGEALLFSIQMYEPNDPYAVEAELHYGLHDIYWIETADGKVFDVAWEYSGDRQCTDEEADSYFALVDEIPQIMETFQLNEGCKKAQDKSSVMETVAEEKPEHYYDIYGDFCNGDNLLTIYVNEDNTIEIEINGEYVGSAEFKYDTGYAYDYERKDEEGRTEILLSYDYGSDMVNITSMYFNDTDYMGSYCR